MTLTQLLFTFGGRIGRKAYWFAVVVMFAAQLVAGLVDYAAFRNADSIVSVVVSVVAFYGSIAVAVKRWHDRDKSGWWILVVFIPIVGVIWLFVENGFLKGTSGPNRYGPDPV